jgi:hypothetical protein
MKMQLPKLVLINERLESLLEASELISV